MRTDEDGGADHGPASIDTLLEELAELRELDERRHAHAPGSPAHEEATAAVDALSERVMDRARDLREHRRIRQSG